MKWFVTACFAAIAACLVANVWPLTSESENLEYRDRTSPPGFRELVIKDSRSRSDPLAGLSDLRRDETKHRSAGEVCDALFRDQTSPAIGAIGSPVQIASFFDYRCPYCRTLTDILAAMPRENLRIVFKEWPVLGNASDVAARAALAAHKQGRYADFHRRLMRTRLVPTAGLVEDIAAELGMSRQQLREDMAGSDVSDAIVRNQALTSELRIAGTPALVVGRTIVEGAITQDQLRRLIGRVLTEGPQSSCYRRA